LAAALQSVAAAAAGRDGDGGAHVAARRALALSCLAPGLGRTYLVAETIGIFQEKLRAQEWRRIDIFQQNWDLSFKRVRIGI